MDLADVGDGRRYVLEPDDEGVEERASLVLSARLWFAQARGRRDAFAAERVDPDYKPVSWTVTDVGGSPVFIADTLGDLARLADFGRRALAISGVTARDRILLMAPTGSGIAHHQLVGGARLGGVQVLHADAADVAMQKLGSATVIAGTTDVVADVVAGGLGPEVRLVLILDGPVPAAAIDELAVPGVGVADWWTPPGARAAWARCLQGRGFHSWPTHEYLEIVDRSGEPRERGHLLWSAVGWHGTVWWRIDTGCGATIDVEPCPCGRTTPRIIPLVRR